MHISKKKREEDNYDMKEGKEEENFTVNEQKHYDTNNFCILLIKEKVALITHEIPSREREIFR